MKLKLILSSIATLGLIVSASAQLVSVTTDAITGGNAASVTTLRNDNAGSLFGPAGDTAGSTWNIVSGYSSTGLLDSTGASTSIGWSTNYASRRGVTDALTLEMTRTFLQQFSKGSLGDATLEINGLTPGAKYNVWLVSVSNTSSVTEEYAGRWSTSNTTSSASTQVLDGEVRNTSTFVQGQNMVFFENVVANGSGLLSFEADAADLDDIGFTWSTGSGSGREGDYRLGLNGFQIMAVPEASAALLIGLAGLTLLVRRRR